MTVGSLEIHSLLHSALNGALPRLDERPIGYSQFEREGERKSQMGRGGDKARGGDQEREREGEREREREGSRKAERATASPRK